MVTHGECEKESLNQDRISTAFHPKATKLLYLAGLLTCSGFNRLPAPNHRNSGTMDKPLTELTATGIVLDFHQIPF